MKTTTVFIGLLFCAYSSANAQSLAPSTVRQIFSLEKGDSLEYHRWTGTSLGDTCGDICDMHRLNVIDSSYYNTNYDTLTITFTSEIIYIDSLPCGTHPCFNFYDPAYFTLKSGKWVITDLDSSIVHLMDTIYLPNGECGGGFTPFPDSIYRQGNEYNDSKQNYCGFGNCIGYQWVEIYADSLGIVCEEENSGTMFNDTEQLIYYHKANGSTWGTPFIYTGISNIANDTHISVYPNPAADRFVIQDEHYEAARFVLYDVLSKQVMDLALTGAVTTVYRNNLPAGIYCWQVIDGGNVMRVGKLVLE